MEGAVVKEITATNASLAIELGFHPVRVCIENLTSLAKVEWTNLMDAGETLKTVSAGTRTKETTNGISLSTGGSIGAVSTTGKGIVLGAMTDINDTTTETLIVTAWRGMEGAQ